MHPVCLALLAFASSISSASTSAPHPAHTSPAPPAYPAHPAPAPPAGTSPGPTRAIDLIDDHLVRSLTGYAGALAEHAMQSDTTLDDDLQFYATDQDGKEDFLAGVLVCRNRGVYDAYVSGDTKRQELQGFGKRAVTMAGCAGFEVTFEASDDTLVVVLCNRSQCKTLDDAVALAHRIDARIPAS